MFRLYSRPALLSSSLKSLPHKKKKHFLTPHGSAAAAVSRWKPNSARPTCDINSYPTDFRCRNHSKTGYGSSAGRRGKAAEDHIMREARQGRRIYTLKRRDCFSQSFQGFGGVRREATRASWEEWKLTKRGRTEMVQLSVHASAELLLTAISYQVERGSMFITTRAHRDGLHVAYIRVIPPEVSFLLF